MKSLVKTESENAVLHFTAVTECRERADEQTSVDDDDVAAVNSSQLLSSPLSKKFNSARSA